MSISAILFLILYFTMLCKAFVNRPIYGLYAYLIAFYANPISRWWAEPLPDLRWSLMAAIVTLIAIFVKKGNNKIIFMKFTESKLFLCFTIFVVLQSFIVLNSYIHMLYVMLVIKYTILIFLIQNSLKNNKDIIGFIIVNLIGCAYLGYLGYQSGGGRLEGIGGPGIESANQLSQHLNVILIISGYLLFFKWGWKLPALIVLIIVLLNTIMMTESRGAIISLVLTGCVAIFFIPDKYKKKFMTFASLGLIAFSILMGPQIVDRFKGMKADDSGEMQDASAASRMVIIRAQFEMFKENPILGTGHRSTLLLSPFYIEDKYRSTSSVGENGEARRASHNFLMGLLVDHGLIGTLLYCSIIYLCLKRLLLIKRFKKEDLTEDGNKLKVLLTSFCLGLLCFMISGLASNHKVNEIDIWLYSIIPLIYHMLLKNSDKKNVN